MRSPRPDAAVLIRPARAGQARTLATATAHWIERGLPPRWGPRALRRLIVDPDAEVIAAARGAVLSGFAAMQYDFARGRAHLVLLAVHPQQRRAGLGSALYGWLEQLAVRGGVRQVQLEVRAGHAGARVFYECLGFEPGELRRGYYAGREDARTMRRRLGPPGRP